MIQVFKTDEDYKKWLDGQTLPSGIVVYVSDNETMYFSTNNIKGELKTYKCEKDEVIQYPPLVYSAKSAGSKLTVNGQSMTLEQGDNITLDYPNEITSVKATSNTALTAITIPNTVTSIESLAFNSCPYLASVNIPDTVTSIGDSAFARTSLTSITIPDGVTSIESNAFNGCGSLVSINIPEGITSISGFLFGMCTSLSSISIPNSVTSIGEYSFQICSSLASITIPENVTSIGEYSFEGCTALTDFNFNGTMAQWGAITLGTNWKNNAAFTVVHCTDGDVSLEEPIQPIQHEYVDLGLPSGLKWAKCNLGAKKETDYGDYFQWGSTNPNTADECTWANAPFNGGNTSYNADAFNQVKDTVAPNGVLAKEYDVAAQIMGGDWRMPTKDECQELLNNTNNEWVTINGVSGRKFTSKTDTTKYIFIPAAGWCYNGSVGNVGSRSVVWSSSLYISGPDRAQNLSLESAFCNINSTYRFVGQSVRGVRK